MPASRPASLANPPPAYAERLAELKARIHSAQQRAVLAVNRELVQLYWQIGRDILARQAEQGWGAKVIERLAHDLRNAFPDMKGFSRANLLYMRAFAEAWPDEPIVQQAVGHLPWGHNLVLLAKLKDPALRLAYAARAVEHGWSRNALTHQTTSARSSRPWCATFPASCSNWAPASPSWGGRCPSRWAAMTSSSTCSSITSSCAAMSSSN